MRLQGLFSLTFTIGSGSKINSFGLWSDRPSYYATNNPAAHQIMFDTSTEIGNAFDYQNNQPYGDNDLLLPGGVYASMFPYSWKTEIGTVLKW